MTGLDRIGVPVDPAALAELEARVAADGVETVRFLFSDQHGALRGKALVAGAPTTRLWRMPSRGCASITRCSFRIASPDIRLSLSSGRKNAYPPPQRRMKSRMLPAFQPVFFSRRR